MREAGIDSLPATPKGLRHGFGAHAVMSGIPLNLAQKWLGHADIATTAIYTDVLGPEERLLAARMW
jgi:integrase/recombinase XerD